MLNHYLLIAWRSFKKNKAYSILNILGLTIGITCSLIIFLYVFDEITYDRQHQNWKNIVRLNAAYHLPNNGGMETYAVGGPVIGEVLVKDFPEVKQVVRMRKVNDVVVEKPASDERFYEMFIAADSNIFEVFTFPFLAGNASTALLDPQTVVLSEKAALKLFNSTDVIGSSIRLPQDSVDLKITGVFRNAQSNTQLKFDYIISLETYRTTQHVELTSWWSYSFYTFLELQEGADVPALENKIKFISRKYIPDQEDGSGYRQEYSLIPFSGIHLYSDLRGEMEPNSKAAYVFIFFIIGVFILAIACINFMNLATARSAMRAKEIGLRKVVGAIRTQLVGQFLGEAFLMTIFAVILSLGVLILINPWLNNFIGKSLTMFSNTWFWVILAAIVLWVALLSGSYPSLFLSAFKPTETLKGNFRTSRKGNVLRQLLVVFQFSISIFLIAGTLIIFNHLQYIRSITLGFDKEKIIFIPTHGVNNAARDFKMLKDELKNLSGISEASLSSQVPGKQLGNNVVRLGWDDAAAWSDMRFLAIDHDFIKTYGLEIVEGRGFDETYPSDEAQAFMLNESGMRRLGFASPKEAIGQKLRWQNRRGEVIGIVKDFHFMSTNETVEPFIILMNTNWSVSYLSLKMSAGYPAETIHRIEEVFKSKLPDRIFEYRFLDVDFDKQYKAEDQFMGIFSFFSGVAIIIACLGLYGLAMFMTEIRTKEMGIRKVLGATEHSLLILFSKDFAKLVMIAFLIAVPGSWWVMNDWLSSFPLRQEINPAILGFSGVLALLIALLTVSYQSIKAAYANPVDSIRN